jgi:teichuronic acid biosynthesis glycosyltransferase TuaH
VSDDYAAGAALTGIPVERLRRAEERLAAQADVVACVSPVLVDKWRRPDREPVLIPNGCDVTHLATARSVRPVPVDLPRPVVGFVGLLSTRIDLELVTAVARRGHSMLLVGRRRTDLPAEILDRLVGMPNVRWVPGVDYDDLPAHLAAMDVGLVPYTDSAFNRASFPLKILEYLAAGLAVVSTDLPAVRWLDTDLVAVATGTEAFADAVAEAAAAAGDEAAIERRMAFAAGHSWDRRAEAYDDAIAAAEGRQAERPTPE